tara:strand:- start:4675 stop:5010 length:336 start_codon:yes stop_codon:yes gene_type:complete
MTDLDRIAVNIHYARYIHRCAEALQDTDGDMELRSSLYSLILLSLSEGRSTVPPGWHCDDSTVTAVTAVVAVAPAVTAVVDHDSAVVDTAVDTAVAVVEPNYRDMLLEAVR